MSYFNLPPSTSSSVRAQLDRLYSRRSAVDRLIVALEAYRESAEATPKLAELCAAVNLGNSAGTRTTPQ